MAVMQSIVFATIVLFVVFIDKAYTIRCYQCNSVNDTGCSNKENIPEIYMKDCPTRMSSGSDAREENEVLQPILCRKVDQTIEYSVNGRHAIRCFECNSYNDTRCSDDIPPQELSIECGDHHKGVKYSFCRKTKQIIEFSVNQLPADTRIIRGCGWDDSTYKNKCYQRSGFGGRQEVCACAEDNCNGSSSLHVSVIGLSIMLFAAYLLK